METLLFTNVKLYDGTGRAPFMADVAVQDEKIAVANHRIDDLERKGA